MTVLASTLDRMAGDLDDLHAFDYITAREACQLYEHATPATANRARDAWVLAEEDYPRDEVRAILGLKDEQRQEKAQG